MARVKLPKQPRSCWGCGFDYLKNWKDADLGPHPDEEGYLLCPHCHEEVVTATNSDPQFEKECSN